MEIEFIKAEPIVNKFDKTGKGAPLLALYYNLGKREVEWSFGVSKAMSFLKVLEEQWSDYEAHKDTLWEYVIHFGGQNASDYKITRTKIQVLKHFEAEVREYIKTYNKPQVAISEPKIETIEDAETGDYVPTLYLPCFPKGEYDIGDGLLPLKLTQKDCKYMFDTESKGVTIKDLRNWNETNPNTPYVKKMVSRDGKEYELTYGVDKINCILKYKRVIQNWKDNCMEIDYE